MATWRHSGDQRQDFLTRALAIGALGTAGSNQGSRQVWAQALERVPGPLPEGLSIYRLRGDVRVNEVSASLESSVRPGDSVTAGAASQVVFVVDAEAQEDRSYACTCYGEAQIQSLSDAGRSEVVRSEYHDQPRYILAGTNPGELLRAAPCKNHTDQERSLIEALAGREPPFGRSTKGFGAPRRPMS